MRVPRNPERIQSLLSQVFGEEIELLNFIKILFAENILRLDDLQLMRDLILFSSPDAHAPAQDAAALMVPLLLAEREGSLCYTLERKCIAALYIRALRLNACAPEDENEEEEEGGENLTEHEAQASAASFADLVFRSAERASLLPAGPVRDVGREAGRDPVREMGREAVRDPVREVGREAVREVGREAGREVGREAGREVGQGENRGSNLISSALISSVRGKYCSREPLNPIVAYTLNDDSAHPPKIYWQRYFIAERALEHALQSRAALAAQADAPNSTSVPDGAASGRATLSPEREEAHIARACAFQDMELNQEQKRALIFSLRANTLIISGGPGTGKTTTVAAILRALFAAGLCEPSTVMLAAPTGRAAQRMQDALAQQSRRMKDIEVSEREFFASLSASTIHRLLEYQEGVFKRTRTYPLKADVLIIDEVSMVDAELMCFLLAALPDSCRLILIGDRDQLPSVSLGAVFSSILPVLTRPCEDTLSSGMRDCGADSNPPVAAASNSAPCGYVRGGISAVTLEENNRSVKEIGQAALACRQGFAEDFLRLVRATNLEGFRQSLQEFALARIPAPDDPSLRVPAFAEIIKAWLEYSLQHTVKSDNYFTLLGKVLSGPSPDQIQSLISEILCLLDTVRILTFTRRSITGLEFCNKAACSWLLGGLKSRNLDPQIMTRADGMAFVNGMPVIVTANDYARTLWNGDFGVFIHGEVWFRDSGKPQAAADRREAHPPASLEDMREGASGALRSFKPGDLRNIRPAFAITVHKSQGSEYDRAFVVFPDRSSSPLLVRQVVYTAITRAKYEVLLYGDDEVIKTALARTIERESGLTLILP
jgi:exodeoxyribonuclease V alpha subunit